MSIHTRSKNVRKLLIYMVSAFLIVSALVLPACSSDTASGTGTSTDTDTQSTDENTEQHPVLASIVTLDAANVTNSSAIIRGEIEEMDEPGPLTVSFEISTTPGYYLSTTPDQTVDSPGEFSQGIGGLFAYMTYYYRVKVVSGDKVSYGEEKSFTTGPEMVIDTTKTYTATINTNFGDIVVDLLPQEAPLAVNNFVLLSREGFYDNIIFHRVVKDFMIQTGDPTGTGTGGPGYKFIDEEVIGDYMPGTLAMANAGPNTNGSQFFICLTDLRSRLSKDYTIFGKVTSGMDVVQQIGDVPVAAGPSGEVSQPTVDVHINTITIEEK